MKENKCSGIERKVVTDANGVYDGSWKDSQKSGFGVMRYANEEVYEGYW